MRRAELRWRSTTSVVTPIRKATQLLSLTFIHTRQRVVTCATPHVPSLRDNKGERDHRCPQRQLFERGGFAQIQALVVKLTTILCPMASATATPTRAIASSPTASRQPVTTATPHSIGLPSLPFPPQSSSPIRLPQCRESWKSTSYCRRIVRNVVAMATGETPAEVATELPEIVRTIQEAWDKLEDKYAVTSLAFASLIALYGSAGMISAIDRLPFVPSIFELVGIGYTGWFAYRNLVFKPDREALIAKIKCIYSDVIGSS